MLRLLFALFRFVNADFLNHQYGPPGMLAAALERVPLAIVVDGLSLLQLDSQFFSHPLLRLAVYGRVCGLFYVSFFNASNRGVEFGMDRIDSSLCL